MSDVTAVIIAYNEETLLKHTLPAIKQVSDRIVIVDMGSTDGSSELYRGILTPGDLVLPYRRENLFNFGFAHPRNYGAKHAKTEWVLAIDCDEWIDVSEFKRARPTLLATKKSVLSINRLNYSSNDAFKIDHIDGIIKNCSHTSEPHRRLYRNTPAVRWEGMIHEEIWIGDINAYYNCDDIDVKLHHLNQFKQESEHNKFGLYSYLTLQAIMYPAKRFGTNEFWFTTYAQQNLDALLSAANDFTARTDMPPIHAQAVLDQLEKDGFAPGVSHISAV